MKPFFNDFKIYQFSAPIFFIILFILMNLKGINDFYVIDEAAFPYGASSILKNGDPYFYNGETRPRDLALWHPPLYIYSLAIHMIFWGDSNFSVRLFGLFCTVLTLIISFFILKKFILNIKNWIFSISIFTALYLFNPLLSESVLVPDIDGTIALPILAGGLLHCVSLSSDKWSGKDFFWSFTFWVLLISTKFTIALLFIPVYLIFVLLLKGFSITNFFKSILAIFSGFFFFVFSWKFFSYVSDVPFSAPFDYFFYSLRRESSLNSDLISFLKSALSFDNRTLSWIGPTLLILFICITVRNLIYSLLHLKPDSTLIFSFFAIYTLLVYNVIGGLPFNFPKYWVVVILPICLVVSIYFASHFQSIVSILRSLDLKILFFPALISLTFLLGINYSFARKLDSNYGYPPLTYLQYSLITSFFVFLILAILFIKYNVPRVPRNILSNTLFLSILVSVFFSQFATFSLHRNVQYSTSYYFGERGLAETILKVKALTNRKDLVLSAKDIGLQSGRPFIEDALIVNMDDTQLREYLIELQVSLVVTRNRFDYSKEVYPVYFSVLEELYKPIYEDKNIDFVIWLPE